MRYVLESVSAAMDHQDLKWGKQHHSPARWGLILAEEFGEAIREANELEFRTGDVDALRYELLQCAAVCCAWVDDLDGQS